MSFDDDGQLNEHGLFVHLGAQRTIEAFVREKQVGQYPVYLVGMVLPEHRYGPAIVALLTLPDGGVLHACARSLGKKKKVNGVLEYDVDYLDSEGLQRYRQIFYEEYGGFALPCLESGPTAAAERMLSTSSLGVRFGPQVGPSPRVLRQGSRRTGPTSCTTARRPSAARSRDSLPVPMRSLHSTSLTN